MVVSHFKKCILLMLCSSLAYGEQRSKKVDETRQSRMTRSVTNEYYEREYREILKQERMAHDDSLIVDDIASGVAALTIGLYGYYNDDRGVLTKIAYNATMTAGVLLVSDAVLKANKPSLLLLTDKYLKRKKRMNIRNYKRGVVNITRRMELAELKQTAYTSGILGSIYLYNAFRESNKGLKNVYYFLSLNFVLVSGASFYKVSTFEVKPTRASKLSVKMFPLPHLSYRF